MPVNLSKPSVPSGGPEAGSVRNIRIEVADGGFLVSCDRVPERKADMDVCCGPGYGQQKVVTTIADLHAYIDEELGDDGSMEADETAETTE